MCCNNLPIENHNRHLLIYSNSPSQRPNNSPGWVDTTMECKDACLAHPNCSAWVMFGNCNTGPNRTRTKHSCSMITDAAASWVDDGSVTMATICSALASSDLPSPLSKQHRRKVNIGTNAGLFFGGGTLARSGCTTLDVYPRTVHQMYIIIFSSPPPTFTMHCCRRIGHH